MIDPTPPNRVVDMLTTTTDKRFDLVARLADAIIDTTLKKGNCFPEDLRAKGFVHQDIVTFWHFANALAVIELKYHANNIGPLFEQEVRYA